MQATNPKKWPRAWLHAQAGLTTVEYVIVLALVAAACVGAWQKFGSDVGLWLGRSNVKIGDHVTPAEKGPVANN